MRTRKYEIAFLLLVCLLAIIALTCNGDDNGDDNGGGTTCPAGNSTRTQGNDEFKRWQTRVYKGPFSVSPLPEFTCTGWHPLSAGDAISTDNNGEVELNLSDCWDGRIYVFKDSGANFQVEVCRKADYPASDTCIPFGDWYVGKCAGEFVVYTGSAKLKKVGTSFSVTFLPEDREITLVVVLEGRVSVEPVESFDPTVLGPATLVSEGGFYFTMPDAVLSGVAGLNPRMAYPLDDLPAVVEELGVGDWMFAVRDKAEEDGVLPGNWPSQLGGSGVVREPGGEGFVVASGGGALADPLVQEAVLVAVDWFAMYEGAGDAVTGQQVTAYIADEPVNPMDDLSYDPERSRALLEEMGYPDGLPVTLLHPAEDAQLAKAAQLIAEDLRGVGIDVVVEAVPGGELDTQIAVRMAAGEETVALKR
jgi:hypothetical protein